MPTSASPRYTRTAIILHWVVAAMVILNVALAWTWNNVPERFAQQVTNTHKSIGIFMLGFVVVRILWRLGHAPRPLDTPLPRWERLGVGAVHALLYVLIVAMPLSGWLYDSAWKDAPSYPIDFLGLAEMPRIAWVANLPLERKEAVDALFGEIHIWLSYLLYLLFAAHVIGALKRQRLDKDPVLRRMSLRRAQRD